MTPRPAAWWRRLDRAGQGLALDLGLYLVSAAFAGVTAATSTLAPHRAWGAVAVWGYAAAALATLAVRLVANGPGGSAERPMIVRARAATSILAWVAVTLVPLMTQAAQRASGRLDRAQEEVVVVELAGRRLLDTGTPYLDRSAIAALPEADRLLGYVPYQPGMDLFGLPRAVFGDAWWTDARVWFALATAGALAGAAAVLRAAPAPLLVRAVQAATLVPFCALTLATGGDDLPVLALCLLALGYAAQDRFGAAGLAVGAAAALKLFAWPVALVLAWYALRRRSPLDSGRLTVGSAPLRPRAARSYTARFLGGAVGLPALALLPAVVAGPAAAVENLLGFPFGHGLVTSPAQSPFPGHLIATGLPGGRIIAAALLVTAGIAIAVGLVRRPPPTAAAVALWAGYGLLVAILLMPSTRFGYLLYPVALLAWAPPLGAAQQRGVAAAAEPVAYT